MPLLIDGNNLLFAARALEDPNRPPGRAWLCQKLAEWAQRRRESVCIVFDGPRPSGAFAEQIPAGDLDVRFSGAAKADTCLATILNENSAARRLLVVSTDREVQRSARRRWATPMRADDFWRLLQHDLTLPATPPLREPPEKRGGLAPGELDDWLREFGFEDDERSA